MEIKISAIQFGIIRMIIILSCMVSQNSAQVQRQQCMNELQPCINYINDNSRPPDSCCQPLDRVIKSMPECLCSLMTIQGANRAEQAGINITDAQTLPGRCGQRINPLGCVTGTPDRRSRDSVPNSFSSKLKFQSLSIVLVFIFWIL
ncbi:lipid transfer-like protein vas [Phtheirospermum japonicum]|uniref:Lipid transfer-like protein vas n=1 Tax=Phtheirospermum japonicum TaxID=374723 RepID=A0A830CFC6_9LAMI|nr:lipid transfer-like protein vas [Phtheirospermum japonicum]